MIFEGILLFLRGMFLHEYFILGHILIKTNRLRTGIDDLMRINIKIAKFYIIFFQILWDWLIQLSRLLHCFLTWRILILLKDFQLLGSWLIERAIGVEQRAMDGLDVEFEWRVATEDIFAELALKRLELEMDALSVILKMRNGFESLSTPRMCTLKGTNISWMCQ